MTPVQVVSKPVLGSDFVARGDLRLLFADEVCWLRAADYLGAATCTPVSGDGGVLAGSEDGAAPVVLARGDAAFVTGDGTTLFLGSADPYALVKKSTDGPAMRLPFGRPPALYPGSLRLADDAVLWAVPPDAVANYFEMHVVGHCPSYPLPE